MESNGRDERNKGQGTDGSEQGIDSPNTGLQNAPEGDEQPEEEQAPEGQSEKAGMKDSRDLQDIE